MAAKHISEEEEIELIHFSPRPKLQISTEDKTKLVPVTRNDYENMISNKGPKDIFSKSQDTVTKYHHSSTISKDRSHMVGFWGKKQDKVKPLKYETIIDLASLLQTESTKTHQSSKENKGSPWFNISQISQSKEALKQSTNVTSTDKTVIGNHKETEFQNRSGDTNGTNYSSLHRGKMFKKREQQNVQDITSYRHDVRVNVKHRIHRATNDEEKIKVQDAFDTHQEDTMRADTTYLSQETLRKDRVGDNAERIVRRDKFCAIPEWTIKRDKSDFLPEWAFQRDKSDCLPKRTICHDEICFISERKKERDKRDHYPEGTMGRDKRDHYPEETMGRDKRDHYPEGTMGRDKRDHYPEGTMGRDKRDHYPEGTMGRDKRDHYPEGTKERDKQDHYPEGTMGRDKRDHYPEGTMGRDKRDHYPEGTMGRDKRNHYPEGTMGRDKRDHYPEGTMNSSELGFKPNWRMIRDKFDNPSKEATDSGDFDFLSGRIIGQDKFVFVPERRVRPDTLFVIPKEKMRQDKFQFHTKGSVKRKKIELPVGTMERDEFDFFPKRTIGPGEIDLIPERTMRRETCLALSKVEMRRKEYTVFSAKTKSGEKIDTISKMRTIKNKRNKSEDTMNHRQIGSSEKEIIDDDSRQEYKGCGSSEMNISFPDIRNSNINSVIRFPLYNLKQNNNRIRASYSTSDRNDFSTFNNDINKNANNTSVSNVGDRRDSSRAETSSESVETTDNTSTEKTETSGSLESPGSSDNEDNKESYSSNSTKASSSNKENTEKSDMETTESSGSLQSHGSSDDNDSKEGSDGKEKKESSSSSSLSSSGKKKKVKKRKGFIMSLWKSSPEEKILLKVVLWFPVGIGISALLYFMIVRKMNLEEKYKAIVGAVMGLLLSLTFSFSVQMRCVMTLVVPSFVGKAGRSYFAAFAIVYLINGPITNIMENCKEVVRSMTCNSALTANHTKVKWMLRLHPVENAFEDLMKDNYMIARTSKSINKAFKPLSKEIEANKLENDKMKNDIKKVEKDAKTKTSSVDEIQKKYSTKEEKDEAGKKVEKAWEKKLDLRCQSTFSNGVQRCKDKMGELWDDCLDKLWILGYVLCLPLKITVFCEIIKLIPGALGMDCNAVAEVSPGFGDTVLSAESVMNAMESGANVNLQYKIVGSADANYMPVEEMRQTTIHEVKTKTETISVSLNLITHCLTFTFLIIFYGAYKYNTKYLTDFHWDNKYITAYFRHIDARRKAQGKKTLLPLKKIEKKEFYDPTKIKLNVAEKKKLIKGTITLLVRVIVSAIICYMDSMFYQVLDIIARNSKIEYHQTGEHIVDIKVYGRGFMSMIVRSFLERFNSKMTLDSLTTNYECLPNPFKTDGVIIGFIFGTYMIVWVFMYFETFGLRMRRVIASFYYRKREKKRVLYLYNEMYRKRIGYLHHMRSKVRKELKNREYKKKVGLLLALKRRFPRLNKCLSIFKSTKETCIICGDEENKNFYKCPTEGCGVQYCKECFIDIKKKCYACGQTGETDDEDDSGSDTDNDEDTSNEDTE